MKKVMPHSYSLILDEQDRDCLLDGLKKLIQEKAIDNPELISKALEFYGKLRGSYWYTMTLSCWEAKYIMLPALSRVPVSLINQFGPCKDLMNAIADMADRKPLRWKNENA